MLKYGSSLTNRSLSTMCSFSEDIQRVRVFNIKARFRVHKPIEGCASFNGVHRSVNNFTVKKKGKHGENIAITAFLNSRWVNIAGVRTYNDIFKYGRDFCVEHDVTLLPSTVRIDSTTAVGFLPNVDRPLLTRLAFKHKDYPTEGVFSVSARVDNFPSLHFRRRGGRVLRGRRGKRTPGLPSFTLFTTGKFTVLGARNCEEINETIKAAVGWLQERGWTPRCSTTLGSTDPTTATGDWLREMSLNSPHPVDTLMVGGEEEDENKENQPPNRRAPLWGGGWSWKTRVMDGMEWKVTSMDLGEKTSEVEEEEEEDSNLPTLE